MIIHELIVILDCVTQKGEFLFVSCSAPIDRFDSHFFIWKKISNFFLHFFNYHTHLWNRILLYRRYKIWKKIKFCSFNLKLIITTSIANSSINVEKIRKLWEENKVISVIRKLSKKRRVIIWPVPVTWWFSSM